MLSKPKSLRSQAIIYVLTPVFLLLILVELIGFGAIKAMIIREIERTGKSNLQKTAYHIDQQLRLPKKLLEELCQNPAKQVDDFLIETLQNLEATIEVSRDSRFGPKADESNVLPAVSKVYYGPAFLNNNIQLHAVEKGAQGEQSSQTTVILSLYGLVGHLPQTPWWNGLQTYLLDKEANMLLPLENKNFVQTNQKLRFHEITGENRQKMLRMSEHQLSGSLPSDNSSNPDKIYGFHALKEAPYLMVVVTDTDLVLEPLMRFRIAYVLVSLAVTVITLFLLNMLIGKVTRNTRQLSTAANRLAAGHFDEPLPAVGDDEIGQLVQNFNSMSEKIKNGVQLQKTLLLAGEIQQRLLPQSGYLSEGIKASGFSISCDETGGDFFDITPQKPGLLFLSVGDVVGHGVGAALLMATIRATLRSEIQHSSNLADCISKVNTLLYRDTAQSGDFATLFLLSYYEENRVLRWVRAGHEPALLYCVDENRFIELKGKGVALGVDKSIQYAEYTYTLQEGKHLLFIGSDGLVELNNPAGGQFGREKIQEIIRDASNDSAEEIVSRINKEIKLFSGERAPDDDITALIAQIS